jgi:excisionase family DNA binding protein
MKHGGFAYEQISACCDRNCEIFELYENILQTIPNNDTMEVVTQTNAVKSPTDSLKATTLVYTVEEIAQMLSISLRSAYNLCNSTTEFRVLRVGGSIRIPKDSFDAWLRAA